MTSLAKETLTVSLWSITRGSPDGFIADAEAGGDSARSTSYSGMLLAFRPAGDLCVLSAAAEFRALGITVTADDHEMCSMFRRHIAGDPEWWAARGFERRLIMSHFKFDNSAVGSTRIGAVA